MRLDHLLSKEHTARSEAFVFGLPGSSYVEHWYMWRHDTPSTLVNQPAESALRSTIGRAVTGTTEASYRPVFTALF